MLLGIEILADPELGLARGLQKRLLHRIVGAQFVDGQRPALAVILAVEIGIVFRTLEVGQHVGVRPAGIAERGPLIVVAAVAADIDHGVDRGRAAEPLAARLIADPPVEARLRHGVERPVVELAGHHQHQRAGRGDHPIVVRLAGFQQRHRGLGILRQPPRHRAAAGAAAHHHKIVCIRHAYSPRFPCLFPLPRLGFCATSGKSGPAGRFRAKNAHFHRHKIAEKIASGPFQTGLALVHTARTQGPWPGLPSQEASGPDRSAPSGVGQFRFGTGFWQGVQRFIAGWSSPVARQAHNLKVIGSNPIPATKTTTPSSQ